MAQLTPQQRDAYWQKTSRLMWIIMAWWVFFSFLIPAFAVQLNTISILGFPLGFYMAAQGSLAIFVIEIAVYAYLMNKKDLEYGIREEG